MHLGQAEHAGSIDCHVGYVAYPPDAGTPPTGTARFGWTVDRSISASGMPRLCFNPFRLSFFEGNWAFADSGQRDQERQAATSCVEMKKTMVVAVAFIWGCLTSLPVLVEYLCSIDVAKVWFHFDRRNWRLNRPSTGVCLLAAYRFRRLSVISMLFGSFKKLSFQSTWRETHSRNDDYPPCGCQGTKSDTQNIPQWLHT